MTSDQGGDPRDKFRQAFRLFGEAAGSILKQGIDRVERHRRADPPVITDAMRQAGARVLRDHRVDSLIQEPAGSPSNTHHIEVSLRDIASEVFNAMQNATAATPPPRQPTTGVYPAAEPVPEEPPTATPPGERPDADRYRS